MQIKACYKEATDSVDIKVLLGNPHIPGTGKIDDFQLETTMPFCRVSPCYTQRFASLRNVVFAKQLIRPPVEEFR